MKRAADLYHVKTDVLIEAVQNEFTDAAIAPSSMH